MEEHRPKKLLDQVRDAVRLPCCRRTAQTLLFDALRAKRPRRLPAVLTKEETLRLTACLSGTRQLVGLLI